MSTTYNALVPMLLVNCIDETVEWYQKTLGFELKDSITLPETKGMSWACITHEQVSIMFERRDNLIETLPALAACPSGGSLVLYMHVKDVDALHAALPEDMTILKPLDTAFYGMREFTIEDCNGYLITFAQKIFDFDGSSIPKN